MDHSTWKSQIHIWAGVPQIERCANNKTHQQWRTLRPTQMLISTILVNQYHGLLKRHHEATGKHSNNNKPLIWPLEKKKTLPSSTKQNVPTAPNWYLSPYGMGFCQTRVGTLTLMSKE
jgi:hypothetical protein